MAICSASTAPSIAWIRCAGRPSSPTIATSPITLLSVATDNESLPEAEEFLAEVRELLDEIDIEVVDSLILVGDPVKEICRLAPDYSLVVVSDSGKFRLKRFFVGSVAFKVMGHAPVSVLNVR